MWTVKAEKNKTYSSTVFRAKNLEEVMEIIKLHEKYAVERHDYTIMQLEEEVNE